MNLDYILVKLDFEFFYKKESNRNKRQKFVSSTNKTCGNEVIMIQLFVVSSITKSEKLDDYK
jgi:hypothetical protein